MSEERWEQREVYIHPINAVILGFWLSLGMCIFSTIAYIALNIITAGAFSLFGNW